MNKNKLIGLIALLVMGSSPAMAYNCTASFGLDSSIWTNGPWGAFFITHPGNTISNLITFNGTGAAMQATFACGKTSYLEVHVVKLDSLATTPSEKRATATEYKYWSRCFGMLPEYTDKQDNNLQFPALRSEGDPGATKDHFLYKYAPDCSAKLM